MISHGDFQLLLPEDEHIFAYLREKEASRLLVVCNFTPEAQRFDIPEGFENARKLISNYQEEASLLRPYEAYMLLTEKE